jgi:hypothetical protein
MHWEIGWPKSGAEVLLTDLITDLRIDLSDPDASLFQNNTLERCVRKAVYKLSRDAKLSLAISGNDITPEPDGEIRELLLLLGQIHACQVMRSATANAFSFSSGDKKVDKSKQPEHWAKLELDLQTEYDRRLEALNPDIQMNDDNYMITPGLTPIIYEQGLCVDGDCECC